MKVEKPGHVKGVLDLDPGTIFVAKLNTTKFFFIRTFIVDADGKPAASAVLLGPLDGGEAPGYIEADRFRDHPAIGIDGARFVLPCEILAMDFDNRVAGNVLISGENAFLSAGREDSIVYANIATGEVVIKVERPFVAIVRWSIVVGWDKDQRDLLSFPTTPEAKANKEEPRP